MQYKVEKNLIGLQDILKGKRQVQQTRGGLQVAIDGVELVARLSIITDLPLIDNNDYQTAIVLGRNTINDGKGGIYYYDEANLEDTDGYNIIPTKNGIGRWIKLRLN